MPDESKSKQEKYILKQKRERRKKHILKLLFLSLFILITVYILLIKTEKFTSNSVIMIKDLSQKQSSGVLNNLLLGQTSSITQDSKLLDIYIHSYEMFEHLNQEYNLSIYYASTQIDFIQRLYPNAFIEYFEFNSKNLLKNYQKDIQVIYDEASSSLRISYKHASASMAQKVVKGIIEYSTKTLNRFERENANIALSALLQQEEENKKLFEKSIEELIAYQNIHHTIDPNTDVQSKSTIVSSLESELIQKEVEYKSKLKYLNKNTAQMKMIEGVITQIKKSIKLVQKEIAGEGKERLNQNVSQFELLKSEVEFNKQRYTQTLIKLEETKVLVKQNAKNLIIVTKPSLSSSYDEPNKFKDILSLLIILIFIYGILNTILSILKDHKD